MSTPINHHYVSQCQIRNFFNYTENKIYLYDKTLRNIFFRKSTERAFSEAQLNSRITDNELDHSTLEKDLKDNFEDAFTKNFEIISEVVSTKTATRDFKKALIELTKYGIAGEIRPPVKKKETDDVINDALFNKILPNAAPELKQQLEELKVKRERTSYSNTIQYSEFAEKVFDAMGGINCILYLIKCDHYFILPDRPSITHRERINEYFNPDTQEIAMVGIPLSSKIFLHAESKKLREYNDRVIELTEQNISMIEKINYSLYSNAYKQVACENKEYLESLIKNIESQS